MSSKLRRLRGLAILASFTGVSMPVLEAQSFTATRMLTGLVRPVYCTAPRGDLERLFIVEQSTARIRIARNGALLPVPFLDINPLVINSSSESGLLGLAFHPQFATNGYFFVHYNDNGGNTVVARYQVSAVPDVADLSSAVVIFTTRQPFANHNGGMIAFGHDGYLYIGLGDGGGAGDPFGHAQNLTSPLGKMLRIDVDNVVPPATYGIPATNPFAGSTSALPEIWTYGWRNPWRWSFDSSTGDLYVGDVGQNAREEIDFQPASSTGGENYGWRCMEGLRCTTLSGCTCLDPALTPPIHEYVQGTSKCVIGGFVYRGCAIPGLQGTYFFADFEGSEIWSFRYVGGVVTEFANRTAQLRPPNGTGSIGTPSSFGEDGFGELYVCDLLGGELFKIVPIGAADCNSNGRPDPCDLAHGFALDLDGDGQPDECQSFYADRATVSVVTGGTQALNLRGALSQAGSTYLVAGSVSGTTPGIDLGGAIVPLNLDAYFVLSLMVPNSGILQSSLGTLDVLGRARASFHVPPGFPEFGGLTVYHAWVRVLPALDFASNFVKVDLVF